jgi:O-Antigen ligase
MSAHALRDQLRFAGFFRWSALLLLGLTAIWSAALVAWMLGSSSATFALLIAPVLVFALGLGAIFARAKLQTPLLACALWTLLLASAVVGAYLISLSWMFAVIPAALTASALLASWKPEISVVAVFALAGGFGTLEALLYIPVGPSVDLLLAGAWIHTIWVYLVRGRSRKLALWPGLVALGIWLLVTAAMVLGAETLTVGLHGFRQTPWYILGGLLIAYGQWPEGTRRRIGKGMLLVALAVGAYATFRHIAGPAAKEAQLGFIATYTNFLDGELGLLGSFPSRHELAAWAAVGIPFCIVLGLGFKGIWRLVAAAATGLLVVAMLGSEVRSGLLAAGAGVALAFVLFQLSRGFGKANVATTIVGLMFASVVAFGVFTLTVGADDASLKRYEVIFNPSEDVAYKERVYKWGSAIEEIDNAPMGHGLGSAGRVHRNFGRFVTIGSTDIDNHYLSLTYEQGFLLAGLFFGALLLILLDMARRSILTEDPEKATLGIAGCAVLVSMLVLGFFGEYLTGLTALAGWMLMGLGIAGFVQPEEEPAAAGEA